MADYTSNVSNGYSLLLKVEETKVDKIKNESTIHVALSLRNGYNIFSDWDCRTSLTVAGRTFTNNKRMALMSYNSSLLLIDQTFTVPHNNDGNKIIDISASFSILGSQYYLPNATLSITGKEQRLTYIPRASTGKVTGDTIGSPVTISINRASEDFKHNVSWEFGTLSGQIAENIDTSATWIPSISRLAPEIPNSDTGRGIIKIETFYAGIKTGEDSITITLSLPDSVVPTLGSLSLSDSNQTAQQALSGNYFAALKSNPKVSFNYASGIYGSTIQSYRAEVFKYDSGQWIQLTNNTTDNNGPLGTINWIGKAKVVGYCIDSRGRKSPSKEVIVTMLEYFNPILSFSAFRAGGALNQINVVRKFKVAPLMINGVAKNKVIMRWNIINNTTGTVFNNIGGSANWNASTVFERMDWMATLSGTYPSNNTFTVEGYIADIFGEIKEPFKYVVGPEIIPLSLSPNGIGVGKEWVRGTVDVNGDGYFSGKVVSGDLEITKIALLNLFYPVGSIYISISSSNPSYTMGGTWQRFANGKTLVGVDEYDSDFNSPNRTGGEKAHQTTVEEMPSHAHQFNTEAAGSPIALGWENGNNSAMRAKLGNYTLGLPTTSVGGNKPHNNLQPYITVYMWRRTA